MTTITDCIINERIFADLVFTSWPRMIDTEELSKNFDGIWREYISACDEDGADRPEETSGGWEEMSSDMHERIEQMIVDGKGFAQDAPRYR